MLARQGNWLYYTKRFVRRHAIGVGMSAAAVMALVAFSIIMSVQAKRIAEQRDLAQQESARAESVSSFMLEVFTAADPFKAQGREVTAKDLLDNAGQRIASDLNQQPEVRARLLEAIGRSYQRQGQYESAVKYLDDSLQLQRKMKTTAGQEILPNTLSYLGIALRDRGDYIAAENALTEAKSILERRGQQQSARYIQLLSDMGRLKLFRSDPTSAERYMEQSLVLARQLYGNAHPETAALLSSHAQILLWQNKPEQAIKSARESVSIYHSTLPEKHPDRVMADYTLGEMLFRQGELDEAADLVEHALSTQKFLYGENNIILAGTLDTLGMIQQSQKQWDAAEMNAREALTITQKALGADNINTAYYHSALADLLIKRKKYIEAEQSSRAALKILQSATAPDHQYLASAEYLLAEVLVATRRSKEAEPLLRANIERWQQANAPGWRIARSRNLLGTALLQLHKTAEAKTLLQESYEALNAKDSGASADIIAAARERLTSAGLSAAVSGPRQPN